eukprot:SAG11_NODE_606_length_8231_cov_5.017462_1_plen_110_part_00
MESTGRPHGCGCDLFVLAMLWHQEGKLSRKESGGKSHQFHRLVLHCALQGPVTGGPTKCAHLTSPPIAGYKDLVVTAHETKAPPYLKFMINQLKTSIRPVPQQEVPIND